ncbi:hypothetical protein [Streptomyces sp. NPDC059176]|uniref:hypothetical protein n=1 Tax=unclassified Streptomyces TaxID=2593676 RepID=UPI0036A74304
MEEECAELRHAEELSALTDGHQQPARDRASSCPTAARTPESVGVKVRDEPAPTLIDAAHVPVPVAAPPSSNHPVGPGGHPRRGGPRLASNSRYDVVATNPAHRQLFFGSRQPATEVRPER